MTGSILEQVDAFGRSHPVAYFSKSLQPAEHNYEIHNKELLAIIHSLKHFRHYLQGNKHRTKIFLDHANLQYFTMKQSLTCQQSRWSLFLAIYDFIIIPKPGKLNKADALSRHPDYKEGIASENADQILLTKDKFLLTPDTFQICTLHNAAIPTGMNLDLKAALQEGIKADRVTGTKLTSMLTSGPKTHYQRITRMELQRWITPLQRIGLCTKQQELKVQSHTTIS